MKYFLKVYYADGTFCRTAVLNLNSRYCEWPSMVDVIEWIEYRGLTVIATPIEE